MTRIAQTGPPANLAKRANARLSTPRHDLAFATEIVERFVRFEARAKFGSRHRLIELALVKIAAVSTAYYREHPEKDWPAFENVLLEAMGLVIEDLRDRTSIAGALAGAIAAAPSWQGVPPPNASEAINWLQPRKRRSVRAAFERAVKSRPGLRKVLEAVLGRIRELGKGVRGPGGRKRKYDRSAIVKALDEYEQVVSYIRGQSTAVDQVFDNAAESRDPVTSAQILAEIVGIEDPRDPRIGQLASYLKHGGMTPRAVARHVVAWKFGASLRSVQDFDKSYRPPGSSSTDSTQ